MSVDPIGFSPSGHMGMFNRYAYTFNDLVNLVDPLGMRPGSIKDETSREREARGQARIEQENILNKLIRRRFGNDSTETITKKPKNHKITAVASISSNSDKIGHAFVILEDNNGAITAKGFWPDEMGAVGFITGQETTGIIADETVTGYYQKYQYFVANGKPKYGQMAAKSFNITQSQYNRGNIKINNFNNPYSIRCMCGSFVEQIVYETTGIDILPGDPRNSPTPRNLLKALK